jgi:hypothetical protein
MNLKYSLCSPSLFSAENASIYIPFRREVRAKVFVASIGMDGDRGCGGKQFDRGDSGEDEGCSQEGTRAQMFVKDKERGQAGKDRFEGQEDGGMSGWEVLLGPTLDGEGGGGGEEAGDREGYEESGCQREVRSST